MACSISSRVFITNGPCCTTGSPSGVGYGRNPKLFMKPGDVIEVEVEGIGVLRNTVKQL